jgi:hypothetical protein
MLMLDRKTQGSCHSPLGVGLTGLQHRPVLAMASGRKLCIDLLFSWDLPITLHHAHRIYFCMFSHSTICTG